MYSLLRKIHYYSAFIVACFLLLFFVSGGVMIMEYIFPRENRSQTTENVQIDPALSESEVINKIRDQYDIRGVERRNEEDTMVVYTFNRPGYSARVRFEPRGDQAEVRISLGTFSAVMNYYHRIRGFDRGFMHTLWAIFYDLSSLALIVFAITGIYLWWKLIPKKILGIFLFSLSTVLTLFTIIYLMAVS